MKNYSILSKKKKNENYSWGSKSFLDCVLLLIVKEKKKEINDISSHLRELVCKHVGLKIHFPFVRNNSRLSAHRRRNVTLVHS